MQTSERIRKVEAVIISHKDFGEADRLIRLFSLEHGKHFWMLLVIAFGLAMDCFAVSLGIGASPSPCTPRSIFRLSFHFGLFQGGMTLLGWLLGSTVVNLIAGFDHWIAMLLLAWVGGRMMLEGFSRHEEKPVEECNDPTRGTSLIMLSVATSIDALGVGLSLALLKVNVLTASLMIGLVSLVVSRHRPAGRQPAEPALRRSAWKCWAALVLIAIGMRIVLTHTISLSPHLPDMRLLLPNLWLTRLHPFFSPLTPARGMTI